MFIQSPIQIKTNKNKIRPDTNRSILLFLNEKQYEAVYFNNFYAGLKTESILKISELIAYSFFILYTVCHRFIML